MIPAWHPIEHFDNWTNIIFRLPKASFFSKWYWPRYRHQGNRSPSRSAHDKGEAERIAKNDWITVIPASSQPGTRKNSRKFPVTTVSRRVRA